MVLHTSKSPHASRRHDGKARGAGATALSNLLLDAYLTAEEQRSFVAQMIEVDVSTGDVIIREGEKGNNFFLVARGECAVTLGGNLVRTLTVGANCGELGLLEDTARTVTVTASSEHVKLLLMHRTCFMSLLGNRMVEKRKMLQPFLERVPVLSKTKPFEMHALVDTAVLTSYAPGATVVRKGDVVGHFRIVRDGCVCSDSGAALHACEYFGEMAIFTRRASESTMTASTVRGAVCVEWSASHFLAYVSLNAFQEEKAQQERAMARTDPGAGGLSARARRVAESAEASRATSRTASLGGERALPLAPSVRGSVVPHGRPVAGRPQQVAMRLFRAARRKVLMFARLDDEQLDQLHAVMAEHFVDPKTVVLVEGEKGNRFYFVSSGTLDAFSSTNAVNDGLVRSFGAGDSFGELALMYNCPRTATVIARTECVLWSLDRSTFRRILLAENLRKASMYEAFLNKVPLFQPLTREERNRIVDALEPVLYCGGDYVIREGERGEHFYLIEAGAVRVSSTAQGELATRSAGDYFGERALQTGEPTIASVTAVGVTRLVRMARDAFIRILGPLAHAISSPSASSAGDADGREPATACAGGCTDHAATDVPAAASDARTLDLRRYDSSTGKEICTGNVDKSATSPTLGVHASGTRSPPPSPPLLDLRRKPPVTTPRASEPPHAAPPPSPTSFGLASFLVSPEPIGEGGFGKVRLAQHAATGERYALKQMSKAHLIRQNQAEHAADESRVLEGLACPFIARKFGSFQTAGHLFLVLELAPGGDVYDLLEANGGTIGAEDARAFVAQLLVALEHLHARSVVHRDVKLENLLLAADGTLKLTDFGFAKAVEYRTFTLCGTPEYLAPEVILNKGYGRGVDYWALGIVLYEMLAGKSPFAAEDHLSTYQNILYGSLKFPRGFAPKAADLVSKLLERDITKRFGLLKRGVGDIKAHDMYAGYDWARMPGASRKLVRTQSTERGRWMPLAATADIQGERAMQPITRAENAKFVGF